MVHEGLCRPKGSFHLPADRRGLPGFVVPIHEKHCGDGNIPSRQAAMARLTVLAFSAIRVLRPASVMIGIREWVDASVAVAAAILLCESGSDLRERGDRFYRLRWGQWAYHRSRGNNRLGTKGLWFGGHLCVGRGGRCQDESWPQPPRDPAFEKTTSCQPTVICPHRCLLFRVRVVGSLYQPSGSCVWQCRTRRITVQRSPQPKNTSTNCFTTGTRLDKPGLVGRPFGWLLVPK